MEPRPGMRYRTPEPLPQPCAARKPLQRPSSALSPTETDAQRPASVLCHSQPAPRPQHHQANAQHPPNSPSAAWHQFLSHRSPALPRCPPAARRSPPPAASAAPPRGPPSSPSLRYRSQGAARTRPARTCLRPRASPRLPATAGTAPCLLPVYSAMSYQFLDRARSAAAFCRVQCPVHPPRPLFYHYKAYRRHFH